ncbi:MAG TPA: cytochrome c [Gaiellaceae bacterium]|nr:cytochrome c [Gaiellaceae bacterium]
MLLALSTGNEIGLAGAGAAFIAFALVSSFVLPRSNPNFPGRGRNWYLLVTALFFVGMMAAVIVFGREKQETAEAAGTAPAETQPAPGGGAGDAAAGKALFTKNGCVACHTFKAAGSTATVGPDLDDLQASADKAGQPLEQFVTTSIEDPNAYVAPGYQKGVMPPFSQLSDKEVADLVAFLTG